MSSEFSPRDELLPLDTPPIRSGVAAEAARKPLSELSPQEALHVPPNRNWVILIGLLAIVGMCVGGPLTLGAAAWFLFRGNPAMEVRVSPPEFESPPPMKAPLPNALQNPPTSPPQAERPLESPPVKTPAPDTPTPPSDIPNPFEPAISSDPPVTPTTPLPTSPPPEVAPTSTETTEGRGAELLKLLNEPSEAHVREGLQQLERSPVADAQRSEIANLIAQKLDNKYDDFTRRAALAALKTWGTSRELPRIVELTSSGSISVRHEAIRTLGHFPDELAIETLAKLSAEATNRFLAIASLEKIGPQAEETVGKLLATSDFPLQLEVCRLLERIGTRKSLATLQAFADGKSPARVFATKAIQQIEKREAERPTPAIVDNPFDVEAEPEFVLRSFLISMAVGDKEAGRKLITERPDSELLWTSPPQPEVAHEARQQVARLVFTRLKVGDKLTLPNGKVIEMSDRYVNESRLTITVPDNPLPFVVIRQGVDWKVDPTAIIASRKAAASPRE